MDAASVVYRKVIEQGQPLIIEEPGFAEICRQCPCFGVCEETFEMSTPIVLDGRVVGVIGFVCFNEGQKRHILDNYEVFHDFLIQMGDLLAAKVRESRELMKSKAVGDLLESIVNRVDEGVLLLDGKNGVIRCNSAACRILDLAEDEEVGGMHAPSRPYMPPVTLRPVSQGILHYDGYELVLGSRTFQVVGREHELHLGECAKVFVFHDAQAMHKNAYRLSAMTDRVGLDVFVGESGPLQDLKEKIRSFATTSSTTLVIGESGTGKELVARALHDESDRADDVFVAVNCSAIPETLLESELFGYVGGAFTGAAPRGRMGRFEQAHGGTLFLDEIGDIALHLQPKLLRVLEQREVTRVGAQHSTPVDIRIIAATNRNLEKMVAEGMFREDLFYRLNVLPITVPPLRERGRGRPASGPPLPGTVLPASGQIHPCRARRLLGGRGHVPLAPATSASCRMSWSTSPTLPDRPVWSRRPCCRPRSRGPRRASSPPPCICRPSRNTSSKKPWHPTGESGPEERKKSSQRASWASASPPSIAS